MFIFADTFSHHPGSFLPSDCGTRQERSGGGSSPPAVSQPGTSAWTPPTASTSMPRGKGAVSPNTTPVGRPGLSVRKPCHPTTAVAPDAAAAAAGRSCARAPCTDPSQPRPKARNSRGSDQLESAIESLDKSVQNLKSPTMLFGQYVGAALGSIKQEKQMDTCIEIMEVLRRAQRE